LGRYRQCEYRQKCPAKLIAEIFGEPFDLALADDRLSVVAGDVVELDTIVVEVVEDGKAVLVTLSVVGLRSVGASGVGPESGGCGSARGPSDGGVTSMVHITSSPEIFLSLLSNQTCEMSLLGRCI